MNVRLLGAAGAVAALALSACGSSSSSAATLTKAEWVTQANALCKDANDRTDALGEPSTMAATATLLPKMLAIITEDMGKIEALAAPDELKAGIADFKAKTDALIKAGNDAEPILKGTDDAAGAAAFEKFIAANTATDDPAAKLGLTNCVSKN